MGSCRVGTGTGPANGSELGASACNILSNAGADSGQEVFHLHVHILPRYADNPGISNMRGPISEDLDQVYSRITAKR